MDHHGPQSSQKRTERAAEEGDASHGARRYGRWAGLQRTATNEPFLGDDFGGNVLRQKGNIVSAFATCRVRPASRRNTPSTLKCSCTRAMMPKGASWHASGGQKQSTRGWGACRFPGKSKSCLTLPQAAHELRCKHARCHECQ